MISGNKMIKYMYFYIGCIFFCTSAVAGDSGTMHTIWSGLLDTHVDKGVVDYLGLKKDEKILDAYLDVLDTTDPSKLQEKDRLALYINAYNAYTVKLILDNFKDGVPIKSIKKIGGLFSGPWKIAFCRIGGKVYTLDNIEHDIIRPLFKDSRVHAAVNCASKSCPPLISTAYEGAILDDQLDKNAVAFVNNRYYNKFDGDTLYVSKIFKWFAEDFNDDIIQFFKKYARGEMKKKLETTSDKVKIKYMDYDWSINGK